MSTVEQPSRLPDEPCLIENLCDERLWEGSPLNKLYWLLWCPAGIAVALIRLALLLAYTPLSLCFAAVTRRKLYRGLLWALGVRVRCNMNWVEVERHTDGCVVALNHISIFDHFPVLAMPGATVMVDHADSLFGKLVGILLFKGAGSTYWKVSNIKTIVSRFREWHRTPEGTTLYITPEATINNGRGLFRFRPEFMIRGRPVIPLAMKLHVPLGLIPNPLTSSGSSKFIRLIMSPYLIFDLTFLATHPPLKNPHDKDAGQAFADGVQGAIAAHLNIPATWHVREDKYRYRDEVLNERYI